jgi:hypothetical protein
MPRAHDGRQAERLAAWECHTGRLDWVAAVETRPDMAHLEGNKHLHMIRGVQDGHDLCRGPPLVLRREAGAGKFPSEPAL